MSNSGDKFKLTSQERRWMVAAAMVVFIVINVIYVWPHFGDWGKAQKALHEKQKELADYKAEVAQLPEHQARLKEIEGQTASLMKEEQMGELMRVVQSQASRSGVSAPDTSLGSVTSSGPQAKYFVEQPVRMQFTAGDKEIISFLLAMSSGNSSIRVRDVDLKPDPSGSKLMGSMVVVGTYQRAGAVTNEVAGKAKSPTPAKR